MKASSLAALTAAAINVAASPTGQSSGQHTLAYRGQKRQLSSASSWSSLGNASIYSQSQSFRNQSSQGSASSAARFYSTVTVISTIYTDKKITMNVNPTTSASTSYGILLGLPYANSSILGASRLPSNSTSAITPIFSPSVPSSYTPTPSGSVLNFGTSSTTQPCACSTEAQGAREMEPHFGVNVVMQKPHASDKPALGFKSAADWTTAFQNLKNAFPHMNAVRMYSTMDFGPGPNGTWPHLQYALESLQNPSIDLKILVGVWSDTYDNTDRFYHEYDALEKAIDMYGCDKFFAVSVGNEDLERVKLLGETVQTKMVDRLVFEIDKVRQLLRNRGCCVPVTHTDTYNEIRITSNPWVAKLLSNVDQAIIANIFPYWENATVAEARSRLETAANVTRIAATEFDKELWLGETGWPTVDAGKHNEHGTNQRDAQNYWNQFGCQILAGNGTAFYYVDWDEDKTNGPEPAWGLFDYAGKPKLQNLSCNGSKPEMGRPSELPKWLGGQN